MTSISHSLYEAQTPEVKAQIRALGWIINLDDDRRLDTAVQRDTDEERRDGWSLERKDSMP